MRRIMLDSKFRLLATMLFLSLFVGLWASTNLFTHTHIIGNEHIAHSHPYSQSRTHTHSAADANLIALVSATLLAVAVVAGLKWFVHQTTVYFYAFVVGCSDAYKGSCRLLRAPPVFN